MSALIRRSSALALGMLLAIPVLAAAAPSPVTTDPVAIDRAAPPGLIAPQIESGGALLNALFYTANGPGPHPTVLLLHGFPGNEKNLDLAQALRRAGFNVLFFHYRGSWGSGGDYRLTHVLDDIVAAIEFLRAKALDPAFRVDATRISVAGHSLGGFGALLTGIEHRHTVCTVALAPADLGASIGALLATNPDLSEPRYTASMPGLQGYGYGSLVADTRADLERYALAPRMGAFAGRALLIVSADQDEAVPLEISTALADAARKAGAAPFEHLVLDADHSFSWNRIELMERVTAWMAANCG